MHCPAGAGRGSSLCINLTKTKVRRTPDHSGIRRIFCAPALSAEALPCEVLPPHKLRISYRPGSPACRAPPAGFACPLCPQCHSIIDNKKGVRQIVSDTIAFRWDSWIRTNEMTESESVALPLGYIPMDSRSGVC